MTRLLQLAALISGLGLIMAAWRYDRKPRVLGDEIPNGALMPHNHQVKRKIVLYHNFFRGRVVPPASNMLKMSWHAGAAKAAQRWADECLLLVHDNITGRYDDSYGQCGQNIFIASHQVPWFFAIKTWYLEKDNFTYGSTKNDLGVIGHYTQMVWASTHEIGCGFAKCHRRFPSKKFYYNYVCNYCPIGNKPGHVGKPYKRGKRCANCRKSCNAKKLCTNSCPVADRWANCHELYSIWPEWLCDTRTDKGRERQSNCKATCQCRGKIH
ncbi:uncharacterized protein CBL_06422 [Carabus blaptoides fortunei]